MKYCDHTQKILHNKIDCACMYVCVRTDSRNSQEKNYMGSKFKYERTEREYGQKEDSLIISVTKLKF